MPKVKILQGLPASGKSTMARQLVRDGNAVGRVNRDDLRSMVFNNSWSREREKIIIDIEKAIAKVLLDNKHSVVIDDTNLTTKHENLWKNFSQSNNVSCELLNLGVDITTCIERDKLRDKAVGPAIIHRMALDSGLITFDRNIVIVDVDGTIANGEHREHFLHVPLGQRKDWDSYFEAMIGDAPVIPIINWVNELAKDHTICIVSGRPDTYQHETVKWLDEVAHIHYDHIFMRRGSDKRPDVDVKSDILHKLPKDKILMAIDDRPSVINGCWRKNGIMVIPVRGECEDF